MGTRTTSTGPRHENVCRGEGRASKFIQQYLGVELEDKNVRSQLFPNTSSAKSAGNTQLSYQIDVKALAQHFVNYWISHEAQYPHLKSWVIQQIEDTGVGDAEGEYRQALDMCATGTSARMKSRICRLSPWI